MPRFGKRYEIKRTRGGKYVLFDIEEHAFVPDVESDTIAGIEPIALEMNRKEKE